MMTTEFNSFDESELGGFTESVLGVRNSLTAAPTGFLDAIVFIDESSPYTEQDLAAVALSRWEALLQRVPTLAAHVAQVGIADASSIWPVDVPWPSRVSYEAVARPPSTADIDRLFRMVQQSQLSAGTPFLYFKVDNSGSMETRDVEPSLSILRGRLDAIGRRSAIDEFPEEDWLDVLHDNLRQDLVGAARIVRFIGHSPYSESGSGIERAQQDLGLWDALWNDAVTQQTITDHGLDIGIRLMYVPEVGDSGVIWPSSVAFPRHVEVVSVGSSVSQRELNTMYTSLFSQISPTEKVRLHVRVGQDGILGESEIGLVRDQLFDRLTGEYAQLDYQWQLYFGGWLEKMTTELRRFIDIWRSD